MSGAKGLALLEEFSNRCINNMIYSCNKDAPVFIESSHI